MQAVPITHGVLRHALGQVAGELFPKGRLYDHVPRGRVDQSLQRRRSQTLAAGAEYVNACPLVLALTLTLALALLLP